ncbi:hypothetical protein FE810_16500 [Thalassotalea litorea]|uniref:Uncharacterized protein n=1 Tax=Thalassotalea litorea TaxID=2020715 RepID=A0A5R9IBF8_9GAMM|nr:hypothetical protein [Thalassotalea litorea]TLU59941.1 hypothetical protein FE810_16500 [Thalassotalea litorea]
MNTSARSSNWQTRNKKNTRNLAIWTLAWVLTMALATLGPQLIWQEDTLYSVLAILLNILIGIGMIYANARHLRGLDEMQQRVQLQSMGITLGVGMVLGFAYSNLDIANVIATDAEISHLMMLMAITYMISLFIGLKRLS